MLNAEIQFPRYVGVAPGTTTIRYDDAPGLGIPPRPTQAWDIPQDAYSDKVKIAVPPNQFLPPAAYPLPANPTQAWVEWPMQGDRVRMAVPLNQIKAGAVRGDPATQVAVPEVQRTFGPFPNDWMAVPSSGYQPVRKGWIHSQEGDVYTLQGPATVASARNWSIVASVISTLALATTATLAVLDYRSRRKK